MKKITPAIIAMALLSFTVSSYAGQYTTYGSGVNSCGSWVKWRKTESGWHQDGQWVNGFISAAGFFGKDLKQTDSDAMLVFMDNYCQKHPLNKISDGARALVKALELE